MPANNFGAGKNTRDLEADTQRASPRRLRVKVVEGHSRLDGRASTLNKRMAKFGCRSRESVRYGTFRISRL